MGDLLGMMDTDVALRLIDEMAEHLPVTLVPFFRGESLLHPDWWKIIAHAHARGIGPIQFTTNGTLLNEENARRLLECGVDFISFSLDTVDPALYEASRRGANYAKTTDNILRFLDMHRASGSDMSIQVSAVETAAHKPGMDDFVAFWRPKVDRVRVYAEHSGDGHPGSMQEHIAAVATRQPCKKLVEDMVILWNGDVAICNHDWQRQRRGEVFANVAAGGIEGAWLCGGYQTLRRAHENNELADFQPCADCEQWKAFYMPEHLIGRVYTREGN
jgi:sulfatase maturation enzyme AslB (radical SAM superfamily)